MSFSSRVKDELCHVKNQRDCCAAAEVYGILLFANTFSNNEIKMVTEHVGVAERLISLVDRVFDVIFDTPPSPDGTYKGVLSVTNPLTIATIMERYGHDEINSPAIHLNAAVLEEEHCRDAFIRGAFLSVGSVSNPEKEYHLELVTRHYSLSREVMALLLDMGFQPKITVRKSNYMIYFKDSEEIEDFLTKSGAPASAIVLMEVKVEKDLRNLINRRVNCETANLSKTVDAAQKHIAAIEKLFSDGHYDSLPDRLKEAAELRMEYPDAALAELVKLASFKVSRSGLNHRLSRIVELAKNYSGEVEQ